MHPPHRGSSLGRFEHLVLLATLSVDQDAYAVSIGREIEAHSGTRPARGALYTTLARLENKGLLASTTGAPTAVRGGKAKRYYRVSPAGRAALRAAHTELFAAWPRIDRLLGVAR